MSFTGSVVLALLDPRAGFWCAKETLQKRCRTDRMHWTIELLSVGHRLLGKHLTRHVRASTSRSTFDSDCAPCNDSPNS